MNFDGRAFIVDCLYSERAKPQTAGFIWSPTLKHWYTTETRIAARLREYADKTAEKEIDRVLIKVTPWAGRIPFPKGLKPKPFQLDAVKFCLERNRSYAALDPGLGKTIVARLITNALDCAAVVVCPPHLVLNTKFEFDKWGTTKKPYLVVPDTMLAKEKTEIEVSTFLHNNPDAVLLTDEAHRFKNPTAQRSQGLFRFFVPRFERVIFFSGTPLPNRPIELFPVLSNCAPETIGFRTWFEYGMRYCAGHKGPWGYDFKGASKSGMKELAANVLGKFMLRIKKADALPDLPPKTEELVFIGEDVPAEIAALEKEVLKEFSPDDLMGDIAPNGHIATYRKELGLLKVEESVKFLKTLLSETEESILVFAHHKDVIANLTKSLTEFNPLVIVGATPMDTRHERVKLFQESEEHRLFIGNIEAAGTGITLTKASRVVFVEPSWVPAANDQASDRAHRIGQKDHVFVQYLCFKNSLDATVLGTVLRKREVINQI